MTYAQIKEKATRLSDKLSREKGARDQIMSQLRDTLGDPNATIEMAEARLQELTTKKDKLEIQYEKAMEKLEAITDWSKV
jgi:chromosome segregation ATPase